MCGEGGIDAAAWYEQNRPADAVPDWPVGTAGVADAAKETG